MLGEGVDLCPVDVVDGNAEDRDDGVLGHHVEEGFQRRQRPSLIDG